MANAKSEMQNVNVQEAPGEEQAEKIKELRAGVREILEEDKAASLEKLRLLVDKYNECAMFNEFRTMKKLDEKIQEVLAKYVELCEAESFRNLREAENPMVAAATMLYFKTVKIRDAKQDDGSTKRVIEDTTKPIDPLRLHKAVKGGIGADKLWWGRVERLNALLTAATAAQMNAVSADGVKIDVTKIKDTMAMREESKKLALKADSDPNNDELLLHDVQETIDAMLGDGYTATPEMVVFLRKAHERTHRNVMTLVCVNQRTMRQCMMAVCHAAITGESFVLEYKKAKKQ